MNKIRFLSITAALLITSFAARGQNTFNPDSPAEPGVPKVYSNLVLLVEPASEAGSLSGAGRHLQGESVRVSATAKTSYTFDSWTDKEGNVLSTTQTFYFTKTETTDTLVAHFRFTPDAPAEPVDPYTILYYRLTLIGNTGSSGVSGGGKYMAGNSVKVSSSTETGYEFLNWTDKEGNVVSTATSFKYTTKAENDTLYANFRFSPDSPNEPGKPILSHFVNVDATDGGTWNISKKGKILEGDSFTLTANVNTGYTFEGWFLNGELYTTQTKFSYTMGENNLNFLARFNFNPDSPTEPNKPALDIYSYYLMTRNGAPGRTLDYPIYMDCQQPAKDMVFQLTFPEEMMPDMTDITLADVAEGYTLSATQVEGGIYLISLIGGNTPKATTPLLTFHVKIAEDAPTGVSYQVKINQVSVTQEDGTTVTARTRNGRMGIFKLGDANGDDLVNVLDVVATLGLMKGEENESYIPECANANEDESINVLDVVRILEIMKENVTENEDNEENQ